MIKKIGSLLIILLFFGTIASYAIPFFPKQTHLQQTPFPILTNLCEDTIIYFQVPNQAELRILYEHVWAYGNATFTIYDEKGQYYDQCVFTYQETRTTKTISFHKEGTYKLVATGVNFRYQIEFSGPDYDYKCVALALPHKAVFRVRKNEQVSMYLPVTSNPVDIHMSNDYHVPARDATIRIYDETNELKETVYLDSTDVTETYEQIRSFTRDDSTISFWHMEIEGHGGGQSKVVVWTNQSTMFYPTEKGVLLTSDPAYYFVPTFTSRSTSLTYLETDHTAMIGSSGHVSGEEEYVDLYNTYVEELDLKISKHWESWRWRERQGSTAMNDDTDPNHINWEGFNMDPFDEDMQYYSLHQIKPILCLQWDNSAFISKHPAKWTDSEMDEFAEFCLAMAIHCVAPDLEDPPVDREPYDILGIMPMNEPNLIYNQYNNLTESADAYVTLLQTVGKRFRNHPDSRINEILFIVPGISPHLYSIDELDYWISKLLLEAEDYVDILSWDQYQYYLLEELDSYEQDITRIQTIMNDVGVSRPIGLSEFGIHGGIPTIQEFYGSTFAKLYTFGALANCINNDMKYPIYFKLIDSNHEPRQKGLLTGITSYPPFSYLPPFSPKPQYYAMQITGWICKGNIFEVTHNLSQLDVLASKQGETIRFGISNRCETTTTISIPVTKETPVAIYNVTNSGLVLRDHFTSMGLITITLPAWGLYYLETNTEPSDSKSDLHCAGSLTWTHIKPGSKVNGSFIIENKGDNGTTLNWEITNYPTWGTWEFTPTEEGTLNPEKDSLRINVTCIVPDEKNRDFTEYVTVTNTDDTTDFELIPIVLSTKESILQRLITLFHFKLLGRLRTIINASSTTMY